MKPRSQRRREGRSEQEPSLISRLAGSGLLIAALIGLGTAIVVAGIILLASGGGGDSDAQSELPGGATRIPLVTPATEDEEELEELARRTIESLPNGVWGDLYDDFTEEFRQRCAEAAFIASGNQSVQEQGNQLSLIRYNGVSDFSVQETTARLVIVGEVLGTSQYTIGADFEKVGDRWYIAPVADSEGCNAFDRLSG